MGSAVLNLPNHFHSKVTQTSTPFFFNVKSKSIPFSSQALITKLVSKSSLSLPSTPWAIAQSNSTKHATLLVETFHEHRTLKVLVSQLSKRDSCPLELLRYHGDWNKDQFWVVVRFLKSSSRSNQILQLFQMWKNIEESRINEFNYGKIIILLGEEALMEQAVSALQEMRSCNLIVSNEIYNSIIHGFANKGNFTDALYFLNEMIEIDVARDTGTYDGLIQAYGKHRMYDEMLTCVKKMELDGCPPDHITYNLLIREFSRGGLLKRMERIYQTMRSKRMDLQSSTLVAMLEAYANFGILEKMEKVYKRVLKSNTTIKEDLLRKLAGVYIENYMFSRLENLGLDLSFRAGYDNLIGCLHLLSHACLLSRRGMDTIVREMEESEVPWNVAMVNTILLAYLKMKDFKHLRMMLSELPGRLVEPDIVTIGLLIDANNMGFDGNGTLEIWRRKGFLHKAAEMNTDPLVLTAFGKGKFLRDCEEAYSCLDPYAREKKVWTYFNLIDLVSKHSQSEPQKLAK